MRLPSPRTPLKILWTFTTLAACAQPRTPAQGPQICAPLATEAQTVTGLIDEPNGRSAGARCSADPTDGAACFAVGVEMTLGPGVDTTDLAVGEQAFLRSCYLAKQAHVCVGLGLLYEGYTYGKDGADGRAFWAYKRACDLASDLGCELATEASVKGFLGELSDDSRTGAIEVTQERCNAGRAQSCVLLASLHLRNVVPNASLERAQAALDRACAAGTWRGCELAQSLRRGVRIGWELDPTVPFQRRGGAAEVRAFFERSANPKGKDTDLRF